MNNSQKNECIFIGGIFPIEQYNEIIEKSQGGIQYAADALQKAMITGMAKKTSHFKVFNIPFIGSYPKRYKQCYISSSEFIVEKTRGYNVRFCNLTGYKLFSKYWHLKRALIRCIKESKNTNITFVVYSIHVPFLQACYDVKRRYPNVKIVLVAPDLPEYMSSERSLLRRILVYFNRKILSKLYSEVDAYILLSKYMIDRLPVGKKPWIVMEGIYNAGNSNLSQGTTTRGNNDNYILYTGTLDRRYGLPNLLEAFHKSSLIDVNLYICGAGDSKEEVLSYQQKDSRIKYFGQIKREEALSLQKGAKLLINPRTPEGEFTKYSFPSKTMEYLASGVPTLLYELPGIPEEYFKYCYTLKDISIPTLTKKIEEILSLGEEERIRKGQLAQQFILENKTPEPQMSKVYEFLNTL